LLFSTGRVNLSIIRIVVSTVIWDFPGALGSVF